MSMTKEQIEGTLKKVQALADQAILKQKIDWLNRVRREAKELGFSSLSELIAFMVDHEKIDHKEVKN
jgi:hypothetical protein